MLIAAPNAAASPTKSALLVDPVSSAVAKSGASVDTEPSMSPSKPG